MLVLAYIMSQSSTPTNDELWPRLADGSFAPLKAVITGASSGVGEEMAYSYARRGAALVLGARRADRLAQVVARCQDLGASAAFAVPVDFSQPNASALFVADAARLLNPTHAGINDGDGRNDDQGSGDGDGSGGGGADSAKTTASSSLDVLHLNHAYMASFDWVTDGAVRDPSFSRMMQVSFVSMVDAATVALPLLENAGHGGGRIVVTSSASGKNGVHQLAAYSAAKHALHGFFESLQQDLMWHNASTSVTINVLGRVDTDGSRRQLGGQHRYVKIETAPDAAEAIIHGGLLRQTLAAFPAGQLRAQALFKFFAPQMHDALVVLNSQSHPCTDSSEALILFRCWGAVRELLGQRPHVGQYANDV